jgi:HlyD family secretion protein
MVSPKKWLAALATLAVVIGGYILWQHFREPSLPPGFASGNGRIEATEVDVTVRIAGRLAEVSVREGDWVEKGQVVARMDAQELEAQFRQAQAQVRQAREAVRQAQANAARYRSELALADKNLARFRELVAKGFLSKERLDQAVTTRDAAALQAAAAGVEVEVAEAAVKVAEAKVEQIKANLDDCTLKTPISGRVLYRLAEPGEVLASGGKVLTVLDLSDVYFTLYLPTEQAGRVTVGSDARIVLDAAPQYVIPAKVSFVSPRSQFTPREVETRTEREKLMFRIKVRIAPELLRQYAEKVKTGLPGVAYVQLDSNAPWPEHLQVKLP